MKKVKVHLYGQSEPVEIEEVCNTYQKGDLYDEKTIYKFPIQHIFRITETDS